MEALTRQVERSGPRGKAFEDTSSKAALIGQWRGPSAEPERPDEYGFFSNVNPKVPHPRWSQATERVIGTEERRPTQPFNGYEQLVGELYKDMKLAKPGD